MMRYFRSAPDSGKLAVDGQWERAVGFRPGELPDLGRITGEVACEAFFGEAFFGVRRRGPVAVLEAFVAAFTGAMAAAADGDAFFATVRTDLGIALREKFLFAELGAEGAWRSVGAIRIDPPVVWERITASPLWRDTAYAKAIEFCYDNGDGTTHWFALPVSQGTRIVPEMLLRALSFEQAFADPAQVGRPAGLDDVAEHDPHDGVDRIREPRPGDSGVGGQQPGLDPRRGGVEQGPGL